MSTTPNYASAPRYGAAAIASAETSRTAPTQVGTVLTAGASGSRLDLVRVNATATTTQGTVRLFVHDGTNYRLIRELQVYPVTPSATQPAFAIDLTFDGGLVLPAGHSLRATTEKAESFHVSAWGGDF